MSNLVLRGSCILALIIFALPASSQIQNGEITGTVIDPSGAVVPDAKIVLQNLSTRYEIQTQTNSAGIYAAKELTVGHYKLTVEAAGFKTATASRRGIECGNGRYGWISSCKSGSDGKL